MNFLSEINFAEAAMVVALMAVGFLVVHRRLWSPDPASVQAVSWRRPEVLVSGAILMLALILSVSEVTQFMTLDETAFGEVLRSPLDRNIASNWAQGASHTANMIWIPITRIFQALAASSATIDAVLKGVHWLIGIALIVCVIWNILALLKWSVTEKIWLAIALAAGLLLLPVNNMALKTLNYDLISLLGSAAAILFVARGYSESNSKMFWIGLIVAALAAQEKLNASLILLLLCLLVGVLEGLAARSSPARVAATATLKAMGLAVAVSLLSYGVVAISLIGDPAIHVLLKTLPLFTELLTVWIYAPLRFIFGIGNELADPAVRAWYTWVASVLTFMSLPLVAATLVALRLRLSPILAWLVKHSALVFPAGLLLAVMAGVVGLQLVLPVFAPMVPLDPSVSIGVMNGVQLHFGAHSVFAHRLAAIGFAYGVLIAAFPTALLVAAGVVAIGLARRPRRAPFFDLMFLVAIVTPGILALMNTPTFNRYLNLPILWAAIVMIVRIVQVWASVVQARRWGWLAWPVVAVAMIVEIAPFRPLYAAFRPITVTYAEADAPAPGHLNFSWTGWGEEAILAGKLIDNACKKDGQLAGVACAEIGIWPVYNGRWFPRSDFKVRQIGGGFMTGDGWPAGADTYYVINRQLIAGGLLRTFPDIAPDFVVGYRGFTMAWVFRGDRLKTAGYRFVWPQ